jgi:cardiolipin synthase
MSVEPKASNGVMNLPNCITIIRILLIPLLVILLLERDFFTALLVFAVAGISDGLDGFLARVLRQQTEFGAYVDPLADKMLLNSSFVTLAILGELDYRLAVVVVSRDIIILGGIAILLLHKRPLEIRPTLDSKITTFVQLVVVFFVLAQGMMQPYAFLVPYLNRLAVLVTILSGVHYIFIGFRILGKDEQPH